MCRIGEGTYQSAIRLVSAFISRPVLCTGKLVLLVVQSWHCSCDHLALETSKAPCLSCELNDPLHGDLDTFFFFGISKVFDGVHDLFDDRASSGIDTLLCSAACECSEERLLTPDGFFSGALVADVVAHR